MESLEAISFQKLKHGCIRDVKTTLFSKSPRTWVGSMWNICQRLNVELINIPPIRLYYISYSVLENPKCYIWISWYSIQLAKQRIDFSGWFVENHVIVISIPIVQEKNFSVDPITHLFRSFQSVNIYSLRCSVVFELLLSMSCQMVCPPISTNS